MSFARDVDTALAAQTDFTISFDYLDRDHVFVTVDGVEQTEGTDYTFSDDTTIQFTTAMEGGETVVRVRKTSQNTRLTDYTPGALSEADLDNDSLQGFYMAQEAIDRAALGIGLDSTEQWDAVTKRIKNLGTPTASTDAATKAYVDGIATNAGNVPTPGDPSDDDKVLAASGGSFSWTSFLSSMISDAASFMQTFIASADEATARSNLGVGGLDDASEWTAGQSGEITTLTDGATIALNMSVSNNFKVTLGGNRTLNNPTNKANGQSGFIEVWQDDTGSRELSLGTDYVTANGASITLTTTAGAVDVLFYCVLSDGSVFLSLAKDVQ